MTALYRLNHVKFAYAKKIVLEIENLEIATGKITALLGKNGAGKSSLLRLLGFLENPQQGKIYFNDEDSTLSSPLSLRKQIVLVAQKPYLLKGTVFENVLLGLKFRFISKQSAKQRAADALEQVGLATFLDRKITEVSGGEAQKIALARALAIQPKVLLLDEPFSHLDKESTHHLSQLITAYSSCKGRSVIFSTHHQQHATTIAHETIFLLSGKCVDITKHSI